MADKFIKIYHPATKGESEVSALAFDSIWKDKGWILKGKKSKGSNRASSRTTSNPDEAQAVQSTDDPSKEDRP